MLSLPPLVILALSVVVVLGMILVFWLNAFLALITAALLVSLLAPLPVAEEGVAAEHCAGGACAACCRGARSAPGDSGGLFAPALLRKIPAFKRDSSFGRDAMNCALGVVWQTTFVTTPIYFMLREYQAMAISVALLIGLSAILKFTWYDRLEEQEAF